MALLDYEAAYERDASSGNARTFCPCCERPITVREFNDCDGGCQQCLVAGCGASCRLDDPSDDGPGVEPRGSH